MIVVTGAGGPAGSRSDTADGSSAAPAEPPAPAGGLAEPIASFVTNASSPPPLVPCSAPAVGKSAPVRPVTYALPSASTATPSAWSSPLPPRYVELASVVAAPFSCVTKASSAPPLAACAGLAVGKSVDSVRPATTVRPSWSTATPPAASTLDAAQVGRGRQRGAGGRQARDERVARAAEAVLRRARRGRERGRLGGADDHGRAGRRERDRRCHVVTRAAEVGGVHGRACRVELGDERVEAAGVRRLQRVRRRGEVRRPGAAGEVRVAVGGDAGADVVAAAAEVRRVHERAAHCRPSPRARRCRRRSSPWTALAVWKFVESEVPAR